MRVQALKAFDPDDFHGQAIVALTYDDGLASQFDHAVPLHLRYGIPATFAIIASRMIHSHFWKRHMSPLQVAELPNLGFEIASHGFLHDKKYREMSDDEIEFDLTESKKVLQRYADDRGISSICIPFSSYAGSIAAITGKHYKVARIAGNRHSDISRGEHPIRSFQIGAGTPFNDVKRIVDEAVEKRQCAVLMLHGIAPSTPKLDTEIPKNMLKKILRYIAGFDRRTLLPVRLRDMPDLTGKQPESPKAMSLPKKKGTVRKPSETLSALPGKPVVKEKDNRFAGTSDIAAFLAAPREGTSTSMTLAEDENFLITYHRNAHATDTVIVGFGGINSKKTKTGFATDFSLANGFDHIYVAQSPLSQYQGLSLEDFKKAVMPAIKGKDVITYGSSLGAYCAVYYGGCIDARIIASAPRNAAHPIIGRKSLAHVNFTHKNIVDNPVTSKPVTIIYDPRRIEDSLFIRELIRPAYPTASYAEVPFGGHKVLESLREAGVLKKYILSIIHEGKIIEVDLKKEESHLWNAEQGRFHYENKNYVEAERYCLKSLAIKRTQSAANFLLSAYVKQKRIADAKKLLAQAMEWFPGKKLHNRFNITLD